MSDRILFLDIDGPLIPGRAYHLPQQTRPFVTTFDPCAVSMINAACTKQKRKIVIHSSWLCSSFSGYDGAESVKDHCINQGILAEHFHPSDWSCDPNLTYRYLRIVDWLQRHPDITDYLILDDDEISSREADRYGLSIRQIEELSKHLLLVSFDNGILMKDFNKMLDGNWGISGRKD